MVFTSLAIENESDLCFGRAPRPVRTRRGLVIGGGTVWPELNFTLPPMAVCAQTMPSVLDQYRQMIGDALRRARELELGGLVVEFETLPPMTSNPLWAIDITRILSDALEEAWNAWGLRGALRVTPNDTREFDRPPVMRRGQHLENMLRTFEGCAAAGADLLSIESVGGKELHDDALVCGDIAGVLFALCVPGVRDMRFLWERIADISRRTGAICAGDTACGFGNTAMVLAERGMIPRVFAAVVRAVTAVRSLAAFECGAVGPGKDCAYENPILKAITGCPMAMEGKTAACAHSSPLGNIAAAACDTWSNESVQNVRLLGGFAPTCSLEQLVYDCRLMNEALSEGPATAAMLRRLLVRSDAHLDPQAYVLAPESAMAIARSITRSPDPYHAGRAAALTAINLLRESHAAGAVRIAPRELPWLDSMRQTLEELPSDESDFIEMMMGSVDPARWLPAEYGL